MKGCSETLLEMLEIPSETGNTEEIGRYLVKKFRKKGLKAKVDDYGNLVAVKEGPQKFLVESHIDTVGGKVEVREKKGRIYGRGACDTKGSWAALLNSSFESLDGGIMIVGTCDEEVNSPRGLNHLFEKTEELHLSKQAIVMEPSSLKACNAHMGEIKFTLEGRTQDVLTGINSIYSAPKMENSIGRESIAVRRINGDGNRCETLLKCWSVESNESTYMRMLNTLEKSNLQIRVIGEQREPFFIPDENKLVADLMDSVRSVLGRASTWAFPSPTDAPRIKSIGIDCVVFGPGELRMIHKPDEHIEVREVGYASQILDEFWKRLNAEAQGSLFHM
jgi:acetylornithine deacetylase/succinyl-diaminopimelate desuccinylase-like protein